MNKLTGENEKRVFDLTEKTKQTFWPTQYIIKYLCGCYVGKGLEQGERSSRKTRKESTLETQERNSGGSGQSDRSRGHKWPDQEAEAAETAC